MGTGAWCTLLNDDDALRPPGCWLRVRSPPNSPPNFCQRRNNTTPSTMSTSPPPDEKAQADAEARQREQAEQAQLPYKWDQTIKDLDITITIDAKYKGKDLDVKISRNALKAAIKGQEPFIDVRLLSMYDIIIANNPA